MSFKIDVPPVGESVTEVTIGQWLKKDGDYVEADEIICEIESEKATLEIPSSQGGVLKILVAQGETVGIGDTIAEINTDAKKISESPKTDSNIENPDITTAENSGDLENKPAKISPVAAKILEEAGVTAEKVIQSGITGRIKKSDTSDVIATIKQEQGSDAKIAAQPEKIKSTPELVEKKKDEAKTSPPAVMVNRLNGDRKERRIMMSTLRKTISKRLVAAKNDTAMLTTFNEVDMKPILETRMKYRERFQEKYGLKLGFMSFFVKASVLALQEYPIINSRMDENEIVYQDFVDISIAVSTDRGLVVPVLFNADHMSLGQIEEAINQLAQKARDNKLNMDEMTGGTFTITNGGIFGSLLSTPILNSPQSAILGMHKIEDRPVALKGEIVIRPMMYLALSYDHRIIDGRESVTFLGRVKELLEDPVRMLLEV
jgi:2-oxoglutarate dehydrogenase E2 component (dihydrolipoamide succinyltransferase)